MLQAIFLSLKRKVGILTGIKNIQTNEYQKMSLAEFKAEIDRQPCAHGKCYTDPRYEYARRHWNGEGVNENKKEAFIYLKMYE